jgi:hypothetical protein
MILLKFFVFTKELKKKILKYFKKFKIDTFGCFVSWEMSKTVFFLEFNAINVHLSHRCPFPFKINTTAKHWELTEWCLLLEQHSFLAKSISY